MKLFINLDNAVTVTRNETMSPSGGTRDQVYIVVNEQPEETVALIPRWSRNVSWSILYETSYVLPGHAGRILGLCSRWHHLDHYPDPVVFAQLTQTGYSAGRWVGMGQAVGCWKIGPAF